MKGKRKALKRIGCLMLAATMCGGMLACATTTPPDDNSGNKPPVTTPGDDTPSKPEKAAWEPQYWANRSA